MESEKRKIGAIKIADSFESTGGALDARTIANYVTDLTSAAFWTDDKNEPVTLYNGMIVTVLENYRNYIWKHDDMYVYTSTTYDLLDHWTLCSENDELLDDIFHYVGDIYKGDSIVVPSDVSGYGFKSKNEKNIGSVYIGNDFISIGSDYVYPTTDISSAIAYLHNNPYENYMSGLYVPINGNSDKIDTYLTNGVGSVNIISNGLNLRSLEGGIIDVSALEEIQVLTPKEISILSDSSIYLLSGNDIVLEADNINLKSLLDSIHIESPVEVSIKSSTVTIDASENLKIWDKTLLKPTQTGDFLYYDGENLSWTSKDASTKDESTGAITLLAANVYSTHLYSFNHWCKLYDLEIKDVIKEDDPYKEISGINLILNIRSKRPEADFNNTYFISLGTNGHTKIIKIQDMTNTFSKNELSNENNISLRVMFIGDNSEHKKWSIEIKDSTFINDSSQLVDSTSYDGDLQPFTCGLHSTIKILDCHDSKVIVKAYKQILPNDDDSGNMQYTLNGNIDYYTSLDSLYVENNMFVRDASILNASVNSLTADTFNGVPFNINADGVGPLTYDGTTTGFGLDRGYATLDRDNVGIVKIAEISMSKTSKPLYLGLYLNGTGISAFYNISCCIKGPNEDQVYMTIYESGRTSNNPEDFLTSYNYYLAGFWEYENNEYKFHVYAFTQIYDEVPYPTLSWLFLGLTNQNLWTLKTGKLTIISDDEYNKISVMHKAVYYKSFSLRCEGGSTNYTYVDLPTKTSYLKFNKLSASFEWVDDTDIKVHNYSLEDLVTNNSTSEIANPFGEKTGYMLFTGIGNDSVMSKTFTSPYICILQNKDDEDKLYLNIGTTDTDINLDVQGIIYANLFWSKSDKTLKYDIKDIEVDNVPKLHEFKWKDTDKTSYGVIAQELEEFGYDNLVSVDSDGIKHVDYNATFSLIISKMQKKIELLEREVEKLKNKE